MHKQFAQIIFNNSLFDFSFYGMEDYLLGPNMIWGVSCENIASSGNGSGLGFEFGDMGDSFGCGLYFYSEKNSDNLPSTIVELNSFHNE